MTIERTADGAQQYVRTSRKGRRYTGSTPEEAERKHLLATLHAFDRESGIGHELCESRYAVRSFGQLTLEQMRELKSMFMDSRRAGEKLQAEQRFALEPAMSEKQRKRIIRLGLYVLAPYYGRDWFWRKCKEWVVRFHDAKRINLDDMTNQEAWYVIQRLERIEKRLLKHGIVDEDED